MKYAFFSQIRIVLAIVVMFSHAFVLTGHNEPLGSFGLGFDLGNLAVDGFFAVSGFLLYPKFFDSDVRTFLTNRIFRLLPGLCAFLLAFACITLFVDLVGVISVNNLEIFSYVYTNASLMNPNRQFVINNMLLTNPVPGGINGSLWTLTFEFWCYLFLILIGQLCKFFNASLIIKFSIPLIISGFLKAIAFSEGYRTTTGLEGWLFHLLPIFLVASSLGLLKSNTPPQFINVHLKYFFLIFFSLSTLLLFFNFYFYINVLIMPTVVMLGSYLSRESKGLLATIDPSYGMYIYAYPTTQILFHFGIHHALINFLVTLGISIIIGCLSWVIIERKFIKR